MTFSDISLLDRREELECRLESRDTALIKQTLIEATNGSTLQGSNGAFDKASYMAQAQVGHRGVA
jgi:hypothetical protein